MNNVYHFHLTVLRDGFYYTYFVDLPAKTPGQALTDFMITEIKHGHNTFLLYAREMSKSENNDLIEEGICGCTNLVLPPNTSELPY